MCGIFAAVGAYVPEGSLDHVLQVLHHRGPGTPYTLEGQVVKICDRVAYINHDIDDAMRAGILAEEDLPGWVSSTFWL